MLSARVVNLSTDVNNKLRIYQEHFERQYIDSTREFYKLHGSTYMTENGVQNYMRYVSVWRGWYESVSVWRGWYCV